MGDRLLRQCYMILAFGMICWIGSYLVIPKSKVSKESLPLDKINGIKILKDCALCDYVNRNGFDPLRSGFKARVRDGELAQRACKSIIEKIKKCCFSSQGKDVGPEIEEFDVKFRSF